MLCKEFDSTNINLEESQMEKRKNRRIPFMRSVTVTQKHKEPCLLIAEDISMSGMRLFSELPLTVGENINLDFLVSQRGENRVLHMQALVEHVELSKSGYVLGVEFVDVA